MASSPPSFSPSRTTCASLLRQLQIIWDEIGESDTDRDNMLLQLEQECLDIYHRKVEETRKHKANLNKLLDDAESEVNNIASSFGDCLSFSRGKGTLKQQLANIRPVLEDLRSKKDERVKEFLKIKSQISQICAEIAGSGQSKDVKDQDLDQHDLTTKKLGELKLHLDELQNEKVLRQLKVKNHISIISELSTVMSIDFKKTLNDVHPSLSDSSNGALLSISHDTLAALTGVVHSLKQEKQQRLQKVQELTKFLVELWDLMEMPIDEQKAFNHVTRLISASVDEVSIRGCLSADVIKQVEVEVQRLNVLKASKMKELVFKRQNELEEIYRGVHMDVDSEAARQILTSRIESGDIDMSELLQSMDDQIRMAKEQALSRRDILDRVEKWKFAAEEEKWLDEYEKDENRYSAVRGAHKNLKRAEKARILVSKIQSMVENLTAKVKAWETEKGIPFLYEKVPLLQSLDEYNVQRQLREEEKRKSREQKRLNEQLSVEQEAMFGSKSATKKPLSQSTHANTIAGTPTGRRGQTLSSRYGTSGAKDRRESGRMNNIIPVNYVALPKDDSASRGS
ncbi:65-kDa microtubule-associated protein 5-like [Vicia villosa]|uniref:65-kDa microtubule-associated protein 5-like n=1 Tax=Vicia villosa TaxID=3911 RepID=UPI00273B3E70|nr:65-kDa microtubule-associated protein 5-like [Vicia villosa]XP_058761658.1 65-kDa microtubule-associated protein 5-like [Vicia villosa]XP_058761659.1 65-kDa microtubule-associated protein 5-like [Vicia villosa]